MDKIQKQRTKQAKYHGKATTAFSDSELRKLSNNLSERIKELNCLYGISRLFENGDLSVDDILKGVINFVPPAWQYP